MPALRSHLQDLAYIILLLHMSPFDTSRLQRARDAARRAALTRRRRAAARKAATTRKRRSAGRKAAATLAQKKAGSAIIGYATNES